MNNLPYQLSIALALLLTISACQSTAPETAPKDLAGLRALLAEKRTAQKALTSEIEDLQDQIATLDTNNQASKRLVTVMPVETRNFRHYVTVQGQVASDDIVNASSEVGGRILNLTVDEGDNVEAGQLIAEVDLESIDKQIAELEKSLELASEIYERQSRLWNQEIGSEIQYLEAKNNKERLEKSLETLNFQKTRGDVYAPISGAVDRVFLKEGELAGPGAPIVQILNTGKLKVEADAPENLLGSVHRGDRVQVFLPAFNDTLDSRVLLIGRTIDQANRTFKIETSISNRSGLIKPNLLAEVRINDFTEEDVVVIPQELVQQEVGGDDFVLVADQSEEEWIAKKVYVTTGDSYEGSVVIKEGLTPDQKLIKDGARSATDQELIAIADSQMK